MFHKSLNKRPSRILPIQLLDDPCVPRQYEYLRLATAFVFVDSLYDLLLLAAAEPLVFTVIYLFGTATTFRIRIHLHEEPSPLWSKVAEHAETLVAWSVNTFMSNSHHKFFITRVLFPNSETFM